MTEPANAVLLRAVAALRDGGEIICTECAYRDVSQRISMLKSSGQCPSLSVKRLGGVVVIRRRS